VLRVQYSVPNHDTSPGFSFRVVSSAPSTGTPLTATPRLSGPSTIRITSLARGGLNLLDMAWAESQFSSPPLAWYPDRSEHPDIGNLFRRLEQTFRAPMTKRTGATATKKQPEASGLPGNGSLDISMSWFVPPICLRSTADLTAPPPCFRRVGNEFYSFEPVTAINQSVGYVMPKGRCSVSPDARWRGLNGRSIHNRPMIIEMARHAPDLANFRKECLLRLFRNNTSC